MDRALATSAGHLEAAWAWGFDPDAWRAHLGPHTWPEVLRQVGLACGAGRARPRPAERSGPRAGTEGEDVGRDAEGRPVLRLPPRLAPGTVKAAAWGVLADAGAEGLGVPEIVARVRSRGLRDLSGSKTPDSSASGVQRGRG